MQSAIQEFLDGQRKGVLESEITEPSFGALFQSTKYTWGVIYATWIGCILMALGPFLSGASVFLSILALILGLTFPLLVIKDWSHREYLVTTKNVYIKDQRGVEATPLDGEVSINQSRFQRWFDAGTLTINGVELANVDYGRAYLLMDQLVVMEEGREADAIKAYQDNTQHLLA